MERRTAFERAFGRFSLGSFTLNDRRISSSSEWSWARFRNTRPAAVRNRRITSDSDRPWTPVTKLGRLVKDRKVTSIEEIYLRSLPIQEYQIVDCLLPNLHDKVLKILPVQKHTRVGLRTRFKAFVAVGDANGHVGLGVKCAKEVASAIRGAIYNAKIAVIPIRRAFWGKKFGNPHTIPCKIYGTFDDVEVRIFPAPRGSGINASSLAKYLLLLGGIEDCFTMATNFLKPGPLVQATFNAMQKTYYFIDNNENKNLNDNSERESRMQWEFLKRKLIKTH